MVDSVVGCPVSGWEHECIRPGFKVPVIKFTVWFYGNAEPNWSPGMDPMQIEGIEELIVVVQVGSKGKRTNVFQRK